METLVQTLKPPYYAVIFTSIRTRGDNGYQAMDDELSELVKDQTGFLGIESARDDLGITVSYWESLEAIQLWRENVLHREAQKRGRRDWYAAFTTRICKVERDYSFVGEGREIDP